MLEEQLTQLLKTGTDRFSLAANRDELKVVRDDVLGRKGRLAQLGKEMGRLTPEEKKRAGKLLNEVKDSLESVYSSKLLQFEQLEQAVRLESEWVDLTAPAPGVRPGSIHPITKIQSEIEQLFISMGFAVLDGPEVETEFNNFDALNIPPDHPASRTRHAGYVLAERWASAQDPYLAGAGPRHAETWTAAADDCSRSCVSKRRSGRVSRAHFLPARRHDGR
jgi:phenylalanyl-tRNA synthetase alpha chain